METKLINKEPCYGNKVKTMSQIVKAQQIKYVKQRQITQANKNILINNAIIKQQNKMIAGKKNSKNKTILSLQTDHSNKIDIRTKNRKLLQLQQKVRRETYEKLKQFQLLKTQHKQQLTNMEQQKTKINKSQ
jgi:hypothetical protein